jgi:hypothetical protein
MYLKKKKNKNIQMKDRSSVQTFLLDPFVFVSTLCIEAGVSRAKLNKSGIAYQPNHHLHGRSMDMDSKLG